MKKHWETAKEKITEYVISNWRSDYIFNKGKVVFIGIVLLCVLLKIVFSIL